MSFDRNCEFSLHFNIIPNLVWKAMKFQIILKIGSCESHLCKEIENKILSIVATSPMKISLIVRKPKFWTWSNLFENRSFTIFWGADHESEAQQMRFSKNNNKVFMRRKSQFSTFWLFAHEFCTGSTKIADIYFLKKWPILYVLWYENRVLILMHKRIRKKNPPGNRWYQIMLQ